MPASPPVASGQLPVPLLTGLRVRAHRASVAVIAPDAFFLAVLVLPLDRKRIGNGFYGTPTNHV